MPNPNLVSYNAEPILIEGDDLVLDGEQMPIKQKILFTSMNYNERSSELVSPFVGTLRPGNNVIGGNSVTVNVRVQFFKRNADGTYGERLKTSAIPEYNFSFTANNSTLVDNATGEILGVVGEEEMEEHTRPASYDAEGNVLQPAGKLHGKTFIKEGDFFDRLGDMDYQPGVRRLIRQYITINKSKVQPK